MADLTNTTGSQGAGDYRAFWHRYLRAHGKPGTRALHYCGSLLALGFVVFAVASGDFLWLLAAPLVGYGFAWTAHFGVEHNRPATFGHPFWSLASDYRMLGLFLVGRLGPHLAAAGVGG
jgi:hypothetical protein